MFNNPVIKKELLNIFRSDYVSKVKQFASSFLSIFLNVVIVVFIVWIYSLVDSKITYIPGASRSIFITLLSFIIFIYTLISLNTITKVLYNDSDKFILRVMPLTERSILFPKLFAIYLKIVFSYSVMFFSIILTYGIIHSQSFYFYVLAIIFTLTTPFIILFIGAIFSYPFFLLKRFINRHGVLQIIISLLLVSLFATIYFLVIQLFIDLITNQNINLIFNADNMEKLKSIVRFFIPGSIIVSNLLLESSTFSIISHILMIVVSILLTYYIALFYYEKYVKLDEKFSVVKKTKNKIQRFPLFFKDIKLLFRNTSSSFSFIVIALSSAIFSTFLAYLTEELYNVYGLNSVGDDVPIIGLIKYLYFPIIVLFITLFISLVFSTEARLFNREEKTKSLILTMPKSFKKQVMSKIIINLFMLLFVNILVAILIWSFKILSIEETIVLFVISLFTTFSTFFLSVGNSLSLSKRIISSNDLNSKSASFVYSILIPFLTFVVIVLFLVLSYFQKSLNVITPITLYLLVSLLTLLFLVASYFYFRFKLKRFSIFIATGGGYSSKI